MLFNPSNIPSAVGVRAQTRCCEFSRALILKVNAAITQQEATNTQQGATNTQQGATNTQQEATNTQQEATTTQQENSEITWRCWEQKISPR